MNKKGSERKAIFLTAMALLGLIVGLAIFKGVSNFLDDTTYWKIYYARDLGLLMDIGMAARGDIEINYNFIQAEKPLVFKLKKQHIEIYDYNPEIKEPVLTTFRFATDNKIIIGTNELLASYFKIFFSEDKVNVSEEPLEQALCPGLNTSSAPEFTLIFVKSDNPEIEELIKNGLKIENFVITLSPELASLSLVVQKTEKESLNFYYEKETRRSKKLSCLIKNQIIEDNPEGLFISRLEKIEDNSEWKNTLANAKLGMLVKVNNLNNEIGKSITKGVISYYG
ncbi:MAG: hypothetical protein H8D38_04675 [DPANN group archaeon]|nr:hypothetical protein [DPANN group archaeon]